MILSLGGNVFAIYAHVQPGSIKVKPGQQVRRGDVLASLGNSGFSYEPHLHFQIADADGLAGEGLPYVFSGYESFGINVADKPLDPSKHHSVKGRFPVTDEVISFPAR